DIFTYGVRNPLGGVRNPLGHGVRHGFTIWAITPQCGGPLSGVVTQLGIVLSEVLKRVLAMLIRAVAGLFPFILLLTRLQRMLHDVATGFRLIGVLGFLLRQFEVCLRRVLLRLHLADVAPRRLAGVVGADKIRSVAHC